MVEQAVGRTEDSVKHWQSALKALPKRNLSAAELKQKVQYEQGLKDAQRKSENPHIPEHFVVKNEQVPWVRAEGMYDELVAAGPSMYCSSVSYRKH